MMHGVEEMEEGNLIFWHHKSRLLMSEVTCLSRVIQEATEEIVAESMLEGEGLDTWCWVSFKAGVDTLIGTIRESLM